MKRLLVLPIVLALFACTGSARSYSAPPSAPTAVVSEPPVSVSPAQSPAEAAPIMPAASNVPEEPAVKAEVKKISSTKAQVMIMNDINTIIDFRSPQEYDRGHISGAITFDDWYDGQKSKLQVDKSKTILVYDRTDRYSARNAQGLVDDGYQNVYDIGAFQDLNGEITGFKPKNPFAYTVQKKLNKDLPEFTFIILGETEDIHSYMSINHVNEIIITNSEGYYQELPVGETIIYTGDESYGFSLDDWNFDGYLDVSLMRSPGGSMHNSPHYYWLWDQQQERFVENFELEDLSDEHTLEISDHNQIFASTYGLTWHYILFYQYNDGHYVLHRKKIYSFEDRNEDYRLNTQYRTHTVISELIGGDMKVVSDEYGDWEQIANQK